MSATGETERIKRLVAYYKKIYGTNNPFEIANRLGVLYQIGNCKHEGCYMFLKNHRYIFLSNRLSGVELKVVMAHELAHAIFDRKENCYFIRNKTLLLNSKLSVGQIVLPRICLLPMICLRIILNAL